MKKQANRAVLKMLRDRLTALHRRPFCRYLLVFLCGATASLALPPAGFLPAALLFSVSVIFAVNEARPLRGAVLFAAGRIWLVCRLSLLDWSCAIYQGRGAITAIAFCLFGLAPVAISFLGMAAYLALRPAIAHVTKLVVLAGLGRRMATLVDFHRLSLECYRAYFCRKFTHRPNGGLYRSAWP